MKTFVLLLVSALPILAADLETAQPVTLAWNYTNAMPSGGFKLYMSKGDTNNWAPITTTTNLSATVIIKPGVYFFYVTALGFWAESDPSNIASTPPAETSASPAQLTVRQGVPNKP